MIKTIGCVECGESVPYGRLSCPVCGALLASVAGARRGFVRFVEEALAPERALGAEPVSVATAVVVAEAPIVTAEEAAVVADAPVAVQAVAETPAAVHLAMAEAPAAVQLAIFEAPTAVAQAPAAVPLALAESPATAEVLATIEAAPKGEVPPQMAYLTVEEPPLPPQTTSSSIEAAPETRWAPLVEPQPILTPRPYRRQLPFAYDDALPARPPSAYRPPTLAPSFATAMSAAGGPSWPSTAPAAVAGQISTPLHAGDATSSIRSLIDDARFVEIAGWFVIVGATMSVLGFLLPWSRSVIGSNGIGGYFDAWGLANPTHSLVLLGLLVVLALAVVHTRVPAWVRSGVVGLALGGLLVGLTWPYLFGPLGADVGVTVTVLGGLALMIGGGVASWATRHAGTDLPV